jgi:glycolate oxidase FAD binding subunit
VEPSLAAWEVLAVPWGGAPRDVLLGCRLLTGTGDVMRFGGEVMKNVAGYDVSRLMASAQGSLGVLLEVSLKVLPAPGKTITLTQNLSETEAHQTMRELAAKPMPLSGVVLHQWTVVYSLIWRTCECEYMEQKDRWRAPWPRTIPSGDAYVIINSTFFDRSKPVWRISLPPAAPINKLC